MITVGELAKLFDISAKTLRYYDDIDLFKPDSIDPKSGYRLYRPEQFETLNSIKFLRAHGLSIAQIKSHMETRDISGFVEQLKRQQKIYRDEIKRLKDAEKSLNERILELSTLPGQDKLGQIQVVERPARHIVLMRKYFTGNSELELNLRTLERESGLSSSQMIGRVGLTISADDLEQCRYHQYNGLFILRTGRHKGPLSAELKKGLYVTTYINAGDHSRSKEYYPHLIKYIKENNYRIAGDAVERVMSDYFITKNEKEFVTEIEIPVTPIS